MTQWGLDVLFNPSKRHMDEEKLRQQSTREEAGDSSGGRRIDLESGRVVIQRPTAPGDADAESESELAAGAESPAEAEPEVDRSVESALQGTDEVDDSATVDAAVEAGPDAAS